MENNELQSYIVKKRGKDEIKLMNERKEIKVKREGMKVERNK